jgi:hypothetical protein
MTFLNLLPISPQVTLDEGCQGSCKGGCKACEGCLGCLGGARIIGGPEE